jgi:ubiquinol-cytochrome c reductase cytochrome b subunit
LYVYPWIEERLTGDRREHHLIDRPRDRPWRTGFGAALFTWVALIFIAGSADRLFLQLGWPYEAQVHIFRALALIAPPVVLVMVRRACRDLAAAGPPA